MLDYHSIAPISLMPTGRRVRPAGQAWKGAAQPEWRRVGRHLVNKKIYWVVMLLLGSQASWAQSAIPQADSASPSPWGGYILPSSSSPQCAPNATPAGGGPALVPYGPVLTDPKAAQAAADACAQLANQRTTSQRNNASGP